MSKRPFDVIDTDVPALIAKRSAIQFDIESFNAIKDCFLRVATCMERCPVHTKKINPEKGWLMTTCKHALCITAVSELFMRDQLDCPICRTGDVFSDDAIVVLCKTDAISGLLLSRTSSYLMCISDTPWERRPDVITYKFEDIAKIVSNMPDLVKTIHKLPSLVSPQNINLGLEEEYARKKYDQLKDLFDSNKREIFVNKELAKAYHRQVTVLISTTEALLDKNRALQLRQEHIGKDMTDAVMSIEKCLGDAKTKMESDEIWDEFE